jgi:hypothetical protein
LTPDDIIRTESLQLWKSAALKVCVNKITMNLFHLLNI